MKDTENGVAEFSKVLTKQLGKLTGLLAAQVFLRSVGEGWRESARIGTLDVDQEQLEQELGSFDPNAGGSVQPLGNAEGWRATYAAQGPYADLFVVMFLKEMPPAQLQSVLVQAEQRIGWLLVRAEKEVANQAREATLSVDLGAEILIDAGRAPNRLILSDQWIARLERALSPDSVSVCRVDNYKPHLTSVSGGGRVSQASVSSEAIELLAAEAVEARAALIIDKDAADILHEEAMTKIGAAQALCIPVYEGDHCRAVALLVWGDPTDKLPDLVTADLIGKVLGESLTVQMRSHPSLFRRVRNWCFNLGRLIFGRRLVKLKLAAVFIAAVLIGASLVPTIHRPAFAARVEARDRLVIAAPFDGFLAAAPKQLGDEVDPGAELIRMEDSDLRLERSKLVAEAEQTKNAIQNARAQRDMARVRDYSARLQQNKVQTALIDEQLSRATVRATRAGLVVEGDASKRVGGRVRLGETLLQIATIDSLAILALVDEDWVADLPDGAKGTLLLAAYPDDPIHVTLRRVTSEAEQSDGRNAFVAWSSFDARPDIALMDGMRGIVRFDAGSTTILGRYGRGLKRWFKRGLWRWS